MHPYDMSRLMFDTVAHEVLDFAFVSAMRRSG
jgi:hypothetical protein